jgi:hypothetical protein
MFSGALEESTQILDSDPEESADHLLALTEEAMEWDNTPGSEPQVLPSGLDSWLPRPYLAAVLSVVSPDELSAYDRISLLKAEQRLVSHYQARSRR